jgi:hypothetical protein
MLDPDVSIGVDARVTEPRAESDDQRVRLVGALMQESYFRLLSLALGPEWVQGRRTRDIGKQFATSHLGSVFSGNRKLPLKLAAVNASRQRWSHRRSASLAAVQLR